MRWNRKVRRWDYWGKWFAWYPVEVETGWTDSHRLHKKVWLEWVEYSIDPHGSRHYRLPKEG